MKAVAKKLLEIKAVVVNRKEPFTWASGIISPIYTDNRLINSYPEQRKFIEEEFAKMIKSKFPEAQILMGTATAGISHAAYVSSILDMPMGYVRGDKKSHGKQNQIEGKSVKGLKVVVIEDLLSTGKSSLEVVEVLRAEGAEVLGVAAIFKYGLRRLEENFGLNNIEYETLTNLDELLEAAREESYIENDDVQFVKEFRDSL